MKINSINLLKYSNIKNKFQNSNAVTYPKYQYNLKNDTVSFTSRALNSEDFLTKFGHVYGGKRICDVIPSVIDDEENYINEGKSYAVYHIPGIDRYLLRVPLPVEKSLSELKLSRNKQFNQVKDLYPKRNYGQAVMMNKNGIQIVKLMTGDPNSTLRWVHFMENPEEITYEMAHRFLVQMKRVADFPQESFDKYAKAVKKCNKNSIDSINPNNIMIDFRRRKIGIIDLSEGIELNSNTREDMIFPLIDIFLQGFFYEKLNGNEKRQLVSSTRKIIKKCCKAADSANLHNNEAHFIHKVVKKVKEVSRDPSSRVKKFQEMYNKTMELYHDDIYSSDLWTLDI